LAYRTKNKTIKYSIYVAAANPALAVPLLSTVTNTSALFCNVTKEKYKVTLKISAKKYK
jgi:hypothetical protein